MDSQVPHSIVEHSIVFFLECLHSHGECRIIEQCVWCFLTKDLALLSRWLIKQATTWCKPKWFQSLDSQFLSATNVYRERQESRVAETEIQWTKPILFGFLRLLLFQVSRLFLLEFLAVLRLGKCQTLPICCQLEVLAALLINFPPVWHLNTSTGYTAAWDACILYQSTSSSPDCPTSDLASCYYNMLGKCQIMSPGTCILSTCMGYLDGVSGSWLW